MRSGVPITGSMTVVITHLQGPYVEFVQAIVGSAIRRVIVSVTPLLTLCPEVYEMKL